MVGAPHADDAIERARRLPDLAVGLHVVLVNGRPVLPPERVPDLVDGRGEFLTDLVRAGLSLLLPSGRARATRGRDSRAVRALRANRSALDHADAQSHMHVHPTVFRLILQIGREYGLRAVRIPREPFGGTRTIEPWLALMRLRARRAGIVCNDYAFGVNEAGALTEERVLEILRTPARRRDGDLLPSRNRRRSPAPTAEPSAFQWAGELAALTSPRVRDAIARNAHREHHVWRDSLCGT